MKYPLRTCNPLAIPDFGSLASTPTQDEIYLILRTPSMTQVVAEEKEQKTPVKTFLNFEVCSIQCP